jgi:hypothetical protein
MVKFIEQQSAELLTLAGGLGDEDVDVAIFRFTLGIPGFDDRLIPRVVGFVGGALLGINHVLGAPAAAQVGRHRPTYCWCCGRELTAALRAGTDRAAGRDARCHACSRALD